MPTRSSKLERERKAKARFRMLEHASKISGNVRQTCRYFGVARSTYYYWRARYLKHGYEGLYDRPFGPENHPFKTPPHIEALVLRVRRERGYGAGRLCYFLQRYHQVYISPATIHRIFRANKVPKISHKRYRPGPRRRKQIEKPGESVQVDVKFVRAGKKRLYQFTAIDEATRYRVLQLYDHNTTKSAVAFVAELAKRLPVAIERIQTDNGSEFGADFSWHLHDLGIKHKRIPPGCPEANGKVERSHRTDEEEFYRRTRFKRPSQLRRQLAKWEAEYNELRPHLALKGRTPSECMAELRITTGTVRKKA